MFTLPKGLLESSKEDNSVVIDYPSTDKETMAWGISHPENAEFQELSARFKFFDVT